MSEMETATREASESAEDVQLQAAQARLQHLRLSLQSLEISTASEVVPTFSANSTRECNRCQTSLPEDRMILCTECDGKVIVEQAARKAGYAAERTYTRLRESLLPVDYRTGKRTLRDLPMATSNAVALCQLLGGELRGLYLHGIAGAFKTSVAAAYLAQRIRVGASGRYVFVPDLFDDIHASYNPTSGVGGDTRAEIVRRYLATPCLVLHDLGKEKASEHAAGVLLEILDGRYRNPRQGDWMIVTSNLDLDALCDRFPTKALADPVRRRLSELTVANAMEAA